MTKRRQESGFLLISAIVLIVVVGFLAATVAYIAITNARSMATQLDSTRAYYVAESGVRRALYAMFSENVLCADLTGSASLTNVSFGAGQFTVTSTLYYPNPAATLTANINDSTAIIPISNLTDYASVGRVTIGSEAINYGGTSTASGDCSGNAPCLTQATRGRANTTAAAHTVGTSVSQSQCELVSEGGVPNLSSSLAKRQAIEDVGFGTGYGGGWIVGNNFNTETLLGWNGVTWVRMGPYAAAPDVNYNDIYINNTTDAWAVGNRTGGSATIIHWDGSTWSAVSTAALPNENLHAVTCGDEDEGEGEDSDDCWAVGNKATFVHYDNDDGWENVGHDGSVPSNKDINALACPEDDECWGAGDAEGGSALIVQLDDDEDEWTRVSLDPSIPAENLNAMTCEDEDDCWAVGNKATFLHYNGNDWSKVVPDSSISSTSTLKGISCVDEDDCWAVGNQSGGGSLFARWNGTIWTRFIPDPSMPNQTLNAISCADTDDCWAIGNGKTMGRWNGSTWNGFTPDISVPNVNLNAISFSGGTYGRILIWRE